MFRRHALLVLGLVAIVALMGCGKPEPAAKTKVVDPLVQSKCTMCHNLDRVQAATYDAAGWEKTVDRMQLNGMVVTDEEKRSLVDALTADTK